MFEIKIGGDDLLRCNFNWVYNVIFFFQMKVEKYYCLI